MQYPVLEINLKKLKHNAKTELDYLRGFGIDLMGVTKVFNGTPETAAAIVEAGYKVVAEAVVDNLKKIKDVPCEKALLRSPGLSEITDVIRYADISLVAEAETIRALSSEAVKQNRLHKILLMIDMGDIREGIWFENVQEIEEALKLILELPGLELYGLGTNFGCYGTVMPTPENTTIFIELARQLENKFGIRFRYLSGGNCTSYHLVERGIMPEGINQLRIGAQYLFGIEYVDEVYMEGYYHSAKTVKNYATDSFILKCEIVEIREKPTVPVGELGLDSFMKTKTFNDRGIRKQAVLALGLQDVSFENIHPSDDRIHIDGQTSNHTIIDLGETGKDYRLGDIIDFEIDYTALMTICNSANIGKIFIK